MSVKKFIAGVGKTYNYDNQDNLLWVGKTLLNSSIEINTDSEEVRAGQGNALEMVYYHTSAMTVTQEEQQFNLNMIARTIGSNINVGGKIWEEEDVEITGGDGEVSKTPVETSSGNIYGWAELEDGSTERFTFSGSSFSLSDQSSGVVCVRYYTDDASARKLEVSANIIPSVVRTVIEAQLFSGDPQNVGASLLIGKVQVEVPRMQMDGTVNIEMTTTGVANTPVTGNALATRMPGCTASGVYATIAEIIDDANWYDNVNVITVENSDITMETGETEQLKVWAIPGGESPFLAPVDDLTFESDDTSIATVSSSGEVEGIGDGEATITVKITEKEEVQATATITVEI